MAYMPLSTLINVFLLLPVGLAMPWIEATPTAVGLMAMNGMSPRPTEAPGVGNVPRELLKRDSQYIFPPPMDWCGFINSEYSSTLTCRYSSQTCYFSGIYGGCCDSPNQSCTYFTACDDTPNTYSDYKSDILYCGLISASCGSYVFKGSTVTNIYFCASTPPSSVDVEYLNDFYRTAVGSTVDADSPSTPSSTMTESSSTLTESSSTLTESSSTMTGSSTENGVPTTSASLVHQSTTAASQQGLPVGAIAGIAVGAGCLALAVIVGIIVYFGMRKRRRARALVVQTQARPQATFDHNPLMQQAFSDQAYPKSAQNVQYPPSNPGVLNQLSQYPNLPQTSAYASTYNGQSSSLSSPPLTHDPTNYMSNITPAPLPYSHSNTTGISPFSQIPPNCPPTMDSGGMGAAIEHATANEQDPFHEVSAVPMHVQNEHQDQPHGQSQGNVYEVSTEPEPRYTANSPTFSAQQQYSYTTYTGSSVQDLSDTQSHTINTQASTLEPFSEQQSSPGPWELSERRGAH